jgi:hypothetical protein
MLIVSYPFAALAHLLKPKVVPLLEKLFSDTSLPSPSAQDLNFVVSLAFVPFVFPWCV